MEKQQILDMVAQYCREQHIAKKWKPGDRINYAGRVYDEEELCNLVDAVSYTHLTLPTMATV